MLQTIFYIFMIVFVFFLFAILLFVFFAWVADRKESNKKASKPKEVKAITMTHQYFNINPLFRSDGDCVIRALSKLLNKDWEDVYRELFELGISSFVTFNHDSNVSTYMRDNGYEWIQIKDGPQLKYFVNPEVDPIAIDSKNHTVYAHGNVLYDSWDSSDVIVVGYFRKIKEGGKE